jgi:hypothetical protein
VKKEVARYLVKMYIITLRHIPEINNLHGHRYENLRCQKYKGSFISTSPWILAQEQLRRISSYTTCGQISVLWNRYCAYRKKRVINKLLRGERMPKHLCCSVHVCFRLWNFRRLSFSDLVFYKSGHS